MSNHAATSVEVKTTGPDYLDWRGDLLARLALARLESVVAYAAPDNRSSDFPYDFMASEADGFCFFVAVKAFSSIKLKIDDAEAIDEIKCRIPSKLLRQANQSRDPVVLFLFDADFDHGRYLRIDTLPPASKSSRSQTISFPIENTIDKESLESLVCELKSEKTA